MQEREGYTLPSAAGSIMISEEDMSRQSTDQILLPIARPKSHRNRNQIKIQKPKRSALHKEGQIRLQFVGEMEGRSDLGRLRCAVLTCAWRTPVERRANGLRRTAGSRFCDIRRARALRIHCSFNNTRHFRNADKECVTIYYWRNRLFAVVKLAGVLADLNHRKNRTHATHKCFPCLLRASGSRTFLQVDKSSSDW